jgi:uncharacterized membrane protein
MRWLLMIVVGLLALLGIGAAVFHYLEEPYNPGFLEFPTITAFHVILGGVYLALAPFQFVQRIRTRWLGVHRWVGRLLVVIGLIVGVTALFMGFVFPMAGWPESVVIGLFGGLYLVALVLGFAHVRAGRIALHREWMMRAFAIGLSIATMRIFFIPALILVGNPTDEQITFFSVGSFTLAFLLHTGVTEMWIRHTRKHNRQAIGATSAIWRASTESV